MRIQTKYPRFVTGYVKYNFSNDKKELHLSVYKISPEEVHLLVRSAKKFYDLVVL
jgi:hypothetical protein